MTELFDHVHLAHDSMRRDGPLVSVEGPRSKAVVPLWVLQYRIVLVTLDLCCLLIAVVTGYSLRFGRTPDTDSSSLYLVSGLVLTAGWVIVLQAVGAYDVKHFSSGPEEPKRVLRATAIVIAVLSVYCYATKTPLARGFVVGVMPAGLMLILVSRLVIRGLVHQLRRNGEWCSQILAVGTTETIRQLLAVTRRARGAGLSIVGACVEDAAVGDSIDGIPVLGGVLRAADAAAEIGADIVAITGTGLGSSSIRQLGWQLEGTGRGLIISPALTEIAGPRVTVSPVEGLPLMWLDQPQLGRLPRLVKRAMDVVGAGAMLAIGAPLLIATAVAIKITSPGPVFYKQRRVGINGSEFTILKFRSMVAGAEAQRAAILHQNEQDGAGVLFKIRKDPRVTPVGRIIRAFSIDELPQLLNVLLGQMSLIGPRPLAVSDSTYEGHARRRLMVRPGLTGLWQVSGRSELSWDDAVRLDLYYVENWSFGLDITILARTVGAVLARKGAY